MHPNSNFRTIEISDPGFERDGLRFMTIKTPHLKGRGDICLFVPEDVDSTSILPIYILLHGVYGSAWAWALKGGAHTTARRLIKQKTIKPAIIAMPSDGLWGDGSAYLPHNGKRFDQWIVSDIPMAIRELIPGAKLESPLCIGGLSMGGFGALCLGTSYPEKFKAISGHSSITAFEQLGQFVEEPMEEYTFDLDTPDIIELAKRHKHFLPAIRFDCGVSDFLIEPNRRLHEQLSEAQIPHIYQEFEGSHEWPYWQLHVAKTFTFFNEVIVGSK